MTILDIYSKYKIMPNLQTHMLRVAGVGKILAEQMNVPMDVDAIIRTGLLHDMGNILKFDLKKFPHLLLPYDLEYWEDVKSDFTQAYGPDEHSASVKIAQELGVSDYIVDLVNAISFSSTKGNLDSRDLNKIICAYSDMRVAINGVVSLEDRLIDVEQRYGSKYPSSEQREKRKEFAGYLRQMEKEIFSHTTLFPEEINDESVDAQFDQLKQVMF